MAKKRVEIALQEEVVDEDGWNSLLNKPGLIVVDVYQAWCGPCSAVVGLFKRLKTEINDDLLHFAVAKADTIETFELYRGKCEPYFLFFGGGCLVGAVKGVNPPELERCIISNLKQEHDILNGGAHRVEICDPMIVAKQIKEAEIRKKREEEEEVEQELTLAVLKPDVVQSGMAEHIIEELKKRGIEILEKQEHLFTTEEAEIFYENVRDQPYFQELVEFMTSGPSEIMVCALKDKQGIIEELKALIGPSISESDLDENKETLRAKYATGLVKNAIHTSSSKEEAARELAFFYPGYEPPVITVKRAQATSKPRKETVFSTEKHGVERTVAVLRPQAYELFKDKILKQIKKAGFTIAGKKVIQLSKKQAEEYYKEHVGQPYFGELTTVMSSGPCLALLLAREDAVAKWREMLGPTNVTEAKATAPESLRAQFTMNASAEMRSKQTEEINLLHGSADEHEVERDVNMFFPVEETIAAIKPDAFANRDEIIERIKAAGFHVAARKETTLTRDMAKKLYEDCSDKPFYDDLVNHMVSGQTLFMVLTRRDAISGWRQLMGPTDPNEASDESSESIRSIYGRDILRNAVHGSSNPEDVQRIQNLLFSGIEASEKSQSLLSRSNSRDSINEEIKADEALTNREVIFLIQLYVACFVINFFSIFKKLFTWLTCLILKEEEQEPILKSDQRVVMADYSDEENTANIQKVNNKEMRESSVHSKMRQSIIFDSDSKDEEKTRNETSNNTSLTGKNSITTSRPGSSVKVKKSLPVLNKKFKPAIQQQKQQQQQQHKLLRSSKKPPLIKDA
ncbi:Thioredoxin domain-containing protein 3 like [Schistosoma japonicum]|nr:Thioredoxin domain-containing protein 3 like [Schistosoma japonicum]